MSLHKGLAIALAFATVAFAGAASAQQKLFVYTSMKESMVGEIKTAFAKKLAATITATQGIARARADSRLRNAVVACDIVIAVGLCLSSFTRWCPQA